jgi:hypothetical protein
MNKTLLASLLAFAAALTATQSTAQSSGGTLSGLAVSGTVSGSVPPQARVSGYIIDTSGSPVSELVSVPLTGGKFSLELPSVLPPQRALSPLRADSLFWPGVLEPVNVTGQANSAELRFYVYGDSNGNGRRDAGEALQEAVPFVGKSVVVITFASAPVQIGAARGFQASLKPGWNGLVIEVGRAVKVTQPAAVNNVVLNTQR